MEYQTLEHFLGDIRIRLNQEKIRRKLAVAAAHDEHTLQAVKMAYDDGIILPILIGKKDKIQEIMSTISFNVPDAVIKDISDVDMAAAEAVRMVREGEADFLMMSDGKLMGTQTANYFSDIYPIDCAVLSANA